MDTAEFPKWMPPLMRQGILRFEAELPLSDAGEIVQVTARFRTDSKLKGVCKALKRKDRTTGEYRLRNLLADPAMDPGEALDDVLGRALYIAAHSVRDGRRTDKGEEAAAKKAEMLHRVAVLREIAEASLADATILPYPLNEWALEDAAHIWRAAERLETVAGTARGPDDPLTVQRDHGDNVQRAVQIQVAFHFREWLGQPEHHQAAVIAGVTVDAPALDASVSRCALSRTKTAN
jgi:hypothetical protein